MGNYKPNLDKRKKRVEYSRIVLHYESDDIERPDSLIWSIEQKNDMKFSCSDIKIKILMKGIQQSNAKGDSHHLFIATLHYGFSLFA